jgi:hypothetical protein
MKKNNEIDRIPYNDWINSQMSVAIFQGWITINWKHYEYDREVVKQMTKDNDDNKLYKPDLIHYDK